MNLEHNADNATPALWQNEYIYATYDYLQTLGEGKRVYLAENRFERSRCIIKQLTRFDEKIYDTLKKKRPGGVPIIYEVNRMTVDGEPCLVLVEEYINGVTLESYAAAYALSEEQILSVMKSLANTLDRLHSFTPPMIHRDIKPENILMRENGNPVLADFNIARNYTGEKEKDTLIMGTEGYAAPEQFGFGETDARTDIYGLGATIKHIMEVSHCTSEKLTNLVNKCTAIDPQSRYQSMRELLIDISGPSPESTKTYRPNALPGFRTGTFSHKVLAIMAYPFLIYLTVTFKLVNPTYPADKIPIITYLYRIAVGLILFSVLFFSANYRNIWNYIPVLKEATGIKRVLLVLLFDIVIMFLVFILLAIVINTQL